MGADLLAAAFAFWYGIESDQVVLQVVPQGTVVRHLLPQLLVLQLHGLDVHVLVCHAPRQHLQGRHQVSAATALQQDSRR